MKQQRWTVSVLTKGSVIISPHTHLAYIFTTKSLLTIKLLWDEIQKDNTYLVSLNGFCRGGVFIQNPCQMWIYLLIGRALLRYKPLKVLKLMYFRPMTWILYFQIELFFHLSYTRHSHTPAVPGDSILFTEPRPIISYERPGAVK